MDRQKEGSSSLSSSSSFTADLFGIKESPPSSSTGIFASIFPPPSRVLGTKFSSSEVIGSWQSSPLEIKGGTPNKEHQQPLARQQAITCLTRKRIRFLWKNEQSRVI
ncbi:hypothetical protein P3X46_015658 [Hevea brasiliensis]|uniref:Uncharacterized protein n=1 Tax=Hevea brasiliensis TaxID=3981 RepID=A0ABQ9LWP7_HEVBR|nr:hypothetical protein P3X46_015658 [Hevea brasiliensis]